MLPGAASASLLDPVVTITGGPSGSTTNRTPTFTFTSTDTNSFQCRLDGAAWFSCSSPYTTPTLSFQGHTFQVRGVTLLGSAGQPVSRSFTVVEETPPPPPVDTTPPDTTITAGPEDKSSVNTSTVTFEFRSSEAGSTFECLVDSFQGAYSACTSPLTLSDLPEGTHTFLARAVDTAGNKDQTPGFRSFVVDAQPDPPMCAGRPVTIIGTDGDDTITGTAGPDVIMSLGGNDTVNAGEGSDRICAGDGNDVVTGGTGVDSVSLGLGNDTGSGGAGKDHLGGGPGTDQLIGGGGGDRLTGSDGSDTISGDAGKDSLNGGKGGDRCDGGDGKDKAKTCEREIGIP